MQGKDNKTKRKIYKKPQLEQVKLAAEEAVLTACKSMPGLTPSKSNGKCVGHFLCYTSGS